MNIRDLCKSVPVTIKASDQIEAAAMLMRERHVGYLVVADPLPLGGWSKPVGVLTDRDIVVAILAKDVAPKALNVGDVMTRQPVVVPEGYSLDDALRQMQRIGVRRIPVVVDAGQLIGVLSLDEVVQALAEQLMNVSSAIRSELEFEGALRP